MSSLLQKICLIGNFNVGKTSLIRRFVENKFSDTYLTTIGVKISRKPVTIKELDKEVTFVIWDIEGKTKEQAISTTYLEGAAGAIIVGDLTRVETLKDINQHIQSFLKVNPQSYVVVALNKSDLIVQNKLNKLTESFNFQNHEQVLADYVTSAKTGEFVDIMFHQLAIKLVSKG